MRRIYFVQAGVTGAIGIGIANDVDEAVKELQRGNPFKLHVLGVLIFESRDEAEEAMLEIRALYSKSRIRGIWYKQSIDLSKAVSKTKR